MSKLVQRIVALVVMLAVVMSATAYGASTFVVDYQELKSDAPVVMTVNGEEIHADEYASYMMSQIINYQQMYAMYGLSEKNMASTFGDAAKESAKQQVALIHIVKQKMDELGLSLSYSQKKNIVTANKQNAEQLGGEDAYLQRLASIGFDMDNYNNYQYVSACAQVLKDYYFGENGVSVPSDDELQKYFDDNYITAKHILILTKNPSTGETTRTDEEAKKEAQAVLDRLNNGEDFDALLTEKNEDAGEATDVSASAVNLPAVNFSEDTLMEWPVNGNILLDYSMDQTTYFPTLDQYKLSPGISVGAVEGAPVTAAVNGTVYSIEQDAQTGTTLTMELGNGYQAVYGQLEDLTVSEGDTVKKGTTIGYIAQPTKYYSTEGTNLYFAMKRNGEPVDPIQYLP